MSGSFCNINLEVEKFARIFKLDRISIDIADAIRCIHGYYNCRCKKCIKGEKICNCIKRKNCRQCHELLNKDKDVYYYNDKKYIGACTLLFHVYPTESDNLKFLDEIIGSNNIIEQYKLAIIFNKTNIPKLKILFSLDYPVISRGNYNSLMKTCISQLQSILTNSPRYLSVVELFLDHPLFELGDLHEIAERNAWKVYPVLLSRYELPEISKESYIRILCRNYYMAHDIPLLSRYIKLYTDNNNLSGNIYLEILQYAVRNTKMYIALHFLSHCDVTPFIVNIGFKLMKEKLSDICVWHPFSSTGHVSDYCSEQGIILDTLLALNSDKIDLDEDFTNIFSKILDKDSYLDIFLRTSLYCLLNIMLQKSQIANQSIIDKLMQHIISKRYFNDYSSRTNWMNNYTVIFNRNTIEKIQRGNELSRDAIIAYCLSKGWSISLNLSKNSENRDLILLLWHQYGKYLYLLTDDLIPDIIHLITKYSVY